MIQFLSVSKLYDNDFLALDDINFEVEEGEFLFLIGPSGSGKTTIIRHLIREEKPTEGRIYFDDKDITKYKRNEVYELRRKIGVIFQDYKLINDKNAYENIAFAMEAAGQNAKDIEETVPYVLDIVGLSHRWNAFPAQLSGGEKQRVAIARALSNNPKLLIADEPTGNLDPESSWDIVQILSKINNWGTTVLMSTHGSEIVDTLGKRVITLKDGKIKKDALKGTYKNDEIEIEKIKVSAKKEQKKEEIKKKEKGKQKEKEKENKVETPKEIVVPEEKSKAPSKQVEPEKQPEITLTDRRKEKEVTKEDFEKNIKDKMDEVDKKQKAHKEKILKDSQEEKKKNSGDIKSQGFSPKLISILKAFGYDTLDSIKKAGYKKISKIDDLSPKDLKKLKEVIS
ncbi:cell division ATP-binding protein FtsE [Candidatus Dojkabacteria bacterium]|nr:cell division ATP-binding protein FtsE [Candidatus Dojkabacteria bacterium]